MNPRINQLVKSLLQKESLEQCSLPELQQFADKNPYFGAAQLLLTKKLQDENAAGFDEQLQKTLLYFHNPLWVEQWLHQTGEAVVIKSKKETVPEPVIDTTVIETPAETVAHLEDIPSDEAVMAPIQTDSADPERLDESNPIIEIKEEMISVESTEPLLATATTEEESRTEPVAAEPPLENPAFKVMPDAPAETELLFEPYHTVDYFASQGIRFREEEKPVDKFGKQLKSFTEWLKTLKKVPASAIHLTNEPATEEKVVKLAETSIQDRDIYTEAMAEVWEKQGNRSKAIDIYSKLSLLEPAKSTYFAAKIEELKKQN